MCILVHLLSLSLSLSLPLSLSSRKIPIPREPRHVWLFPSCSFRFTYSLLSDRQAGIMREICLGNGCSLVSILLAPLSTV
uniref:Putative secreted peptide n=1 Tax=Anopheles braziliensis TaxID=58242 RepID=A0A2M3ZMC9_9DIPT